MREPKEFLKDLCVYSHILDFKDAVKAIENAQREAYNEALQNAAKSADADVKFAGWGKECQLDSSEAWAEIDKQSILKLKHHD